MSAENKANKEQSTLNRSWKDYWKTGVSYAGDHKILIRGYSLQDLIENVSYTEILYLCLKGELPSKEQRRVFDAVVSGIVDHYFFASTTPAARFVASTGHATPIPAFAAGILAMGSHTVSPQDTAELIEKAIEKMEKKGLSQEEAAEEIINDYIKARKNIPGIGHPLHPDGDPRAIAIKKVAEANGFFKEKSEMYEAIQKAFEKKTKKKLPINVDGMMACVLADMGFNPIEMAGVAAISFMPGIIAHVTEETLHGMPVRIIPPELGAKYVGNTEKTLPDEFKRGPKP